MSLKDLFLMIRKNEQIEELKEKIKSLEKEIFDMKKEPKQTETIVEKEPPIIIEKINIERVYLDKYELNNNFGQLGIKELKGRLNIGATYGVDPFKTFSDAEEIKEERNERKEKNEKKGPEVNIRGKKEE